MPVLRASQDGGDMGAQPALHSSNWGLETSSDCLISLPVKCAYWCHTDHRALQQHKKTEVMLAKKLGGAS